MSFKRYLSFLALCLFLACAQAGTKVLDVELGVSSLDEVRKIASSAGTVRNADTNDWTQGPSLAVEGGDYGIDGLQSVHYIFDTSDKLVFVGMIFSKGRFKDLFDLLAGKYKLVKQVRPFVGDQYAKFTAPDAVIELDEPHMSFNMEARYMTPAFVKAWQAGVKGLNQQKRSQEKAKL